ncbi:hypothetical protein [Rheinheimera soli]|uniref:hypothetical protein n=1 Tax=Rheinheimera soli TaxID=443616 RepID=UPI001E375DC6|nr:hypothetical protein [Rheinheimera soli]
MEDNLLLMNRRQIKNRQERFLTALAGPKGVRHGWQANKKLSGMIFNSFSWPEGFAPWMAGK